MKIIKVEKNHFEYSTSKEEEQYVNLILNLVAQKNPELAFNIRHENEEIIFYVKGEDATLKMIKILQEELVREMDKEISKIGEEKKEEK